MSRELHLEKLDHLPDWMQTRCAACGEYALPNSCTVVSNGKPAVHCGGEQGCQRNRERMARLPVEAIVMHQALIEARRMLGVFVNDCPEESWNDDVANAVMAAMSSLDRGLAADRLVAFEAQEAA